MLEHDLAVQKDEEEMRALIGLAASDGVHRNQAASRLDRAIRRRRRRK